MRAQEKTEEYFIKLESEKEANGMWAVEEALSQRGSREMAIEDCPSEIPHHHPVLASPFLLQAAAPPPPRLRHSSYVAVEGPDSPPQPPLRPHSAGPHLLRSVHHSVAGAVGEVPGGGDCGSFGETRNLRQIGGGGGDQLWGVCGIPRGKDDGTSVGREGGDCQLGLGENGGR
ncbi:hypothetical protein MA16_Dca027324 [Dendrobium catenatum]|uniref:Uncharacterized protein n=1 Tax=Dendrobium catenatum TaxID=906689 RepID=A0A2I0VTC5_9ASPA|nr:hypothetical protein MA16_Dca027324 [Dendrobium catenatum]